MSAIIKNRIEYIDVIRGIAIFLMIAANSAPYIMNEPYNFAFRVFSSLAAPLFIALSGYMLGLHSTNLKTWRTVYKGGLIVLTGVLVDVFIWDLMPFVSYDVLYLIGICVMLYPLISLMNRVQNIAWIVAVFVVSFISQFVFNYQIRNTAFQFDWNNLGIVFHQSKFLLFDGWFPIFPWAGIFLLGHFAGKYTILLKRKQKLYVLIISIAVLLFAVFLLFLQNRPTREGYCELFYPADVFYCLTAVSLLVIFAIIYKIFNTRIWEPLRWLGRSSLFFYVLHLIIIRFFIEKLHLLFGEHLFITFIVFYIFTFIVGFLLYKLKKTGVWQNLPFILRFLLGS